MTETGTPKFMKSSYRQTDGRRIQLPSPLTGCGVG